MVRTPITTLTETALLLRAPSAREIIKHDLNPVETLVLVDAVKGQVVAHLSRDDLFDLNGMRFDMEGLS